MSEIRPVVTDDILAQIERVAALATKGPFIVNRYDNDNGTINWQIQQEPPPSEVIANVTDDEPRRARYDAALMAYGLNWLPGCTADLRAFRQAARDLKEKAYHAETAAERYNLILDFCDKVLP